MSIIPDLKPYLSVPVRSVYYISKFIPLTEEEYQAILIHDGQYVDDNSSFATKECKLALILQYADTWAGFVMEEVSVKYGDK